MTKAWTWPLPKGAGPRRCSIESITLRRCFGSDESAARSYAEAKGGDIGVELIRASIVKVNGEPVEQPFGDLDKWNRRTRDFVGMAWNTINGTLKKERDAFIASATAVVSGGWVFAIPKATDDKRACEIARIVAREITGIDEDAAAKAAKLVSEDESIARVLAGIVSIDDSPITQERFSALSSRARRFIIDAFEHVNGTSSDIDDFLSSACQEDETVEVTVHGADDEESSSEAG